MSDDEDAPQLSSQTLAILQEFLQEQVSKDTKDGLDEDWQLSQFWYNESTTQYLSQAIVKACNENDRIALISCPTLFNSVKTKIETSHKNLAVILFEYDRRFSVFGPEFEFYDYNAPLTLDSKFSQYFNLIVADPPFLSDECLSKTSQTIKHIGTPDSKIILCTGAVMESLGTELLGIKKCEFKPQHKNNLGNEFICLTNFGEI